MRRVFAGAVLTSLALASCGDATTSEARPVVAEQPIRITYGEAPQQFGDLSLPGPDMAPVVVLIHGGFWRNRYGLDLMEPLAADLLARGFAVWNLEYRRLGDPGGGWPGTFDDIARGIDALVDVADGHSIDLDRIGLVGHSAGGHLALWAASRASLPHDAPGSSPSVAPILAVGQGAVVDLRGAATAALSNGAAAELLGGSPPDVADRYDLATPRLDAGPRVVSIVGGADDIVPPRFSVDPDQPDAIETVTVDGADHFDLIDPAHDAWAAVVDALLAAIPPSP